MNSHSISLSLAALVAMLAGVPALAASYSWDNGVGTADYIGTGQWTNNTNWDPTSPSGGPAAGDDLTFDLYLNNPRVPRTVSLGATSVEVLAAARASLEVGGPSFRVNSAAG